MKPFFLLLLLAFTFSASAQQLAPGIEWQKCLGGSGEDRAHSIIKAVDNGYIVAGFTNSTNGDLTAHYGAPDSSDAWVVKLSSTGTIEWQRNYGGTGVDIFNTIVRTSDDHYICYGTTTSYNNNDVSGSRGQGDLWVVKLDRYGNIVWQKCLGGSKRETAGNMKLNSDGSILIIGTTFSNDGDVSGLHNPTANRSDAWVAKLDASSGNVLMQHCWGTDLDDKGVDIVETSDGGYCFAVSSPGQSGDFAGISGYTPLAIVAKVIGTDIVRTWNTASRAEPLSMTTVSADKFVVTHTRQICHPYSNAGLVITEINAQTGAENALKSFSYCSYSMEEGSIYSTGNSGYLRMNATESVTVGGYDTAMNVPEPIGNTDGFIAGYNTGGVETWRKYIGGTNVDKLQSVAHVNDYEFVVAGYTLSNNVDVSGNHGNYDIWVVKLGEVNLVKGTIFPDYNSNGTKDTDEPYVSNLLVQTSKAGVQASSLTGNGLFSNYVDTGNFTTEVIGTIPYHTIVPASFSSSFNTYNNTDSFSFAVQPIPGKRDYHINLLTWDWVRPGFEAWYHIHFTNGGTDTLTNRTVTFIKDNRLTFLEATVTPTSISGDTLRWNIAELLPRMSGGMQVKLRAGAPPELDVNDTIRLVALIDTTGDLLQSNNISELAVLIRGAIDPNDKQESHNGTLTLTELADGKPLLYTIRFQNTGTDTAFTVVIRDTLDANTDWTSLQMIGASHNYEFAIKDGKYCTWTFNNILLADSNVNEPLSHGYIAFRIKPKAGLALGSQIKNNASIYFDFMPPVMTNTVITEVRPDPPAQPAITGLQTSYCNTTLVTSVKITNLPATGSGTTVTVKIDGNIVGVGADSTFSFNVSTLAAGQHNISIQYGNITANRISSSDFTVTEAATPDVNVSANVTTITTLATPVIVTAVNATGGGTAPLYTFARDRNFTNIAQAESVNNTWTFNASTLTVGDNKIFVRMKSNANCVVVNTATDSILLVRSSVTGITDPDMPNQLISISPNPFKDAIVVSGLSSSKSYTVTLYNFEGKQLLSRRVSNRSTLNIARQHQATGIYWLSIFDEKRKQHLGTVKLLKQ